MKFASALTTKKDPLDAIQDLVSQVRSELGPEKTDLALLFVHPEFLPQLNEIYEPLRNAIGARHWIGCSGASIIGGHREVENEPAISLLVAQLPEVEIAPFTVTQHELEESSGPAFWHFQLEVTPDDNPNILLFADPFSIQSMQLVGALGEAYPAAPVAGGLASGGQQSGDCRLFLDDQILDEGGVGIALTGKIALRTIVSQGCRPIGQPLTITRAEKNIILELAGRPPLEVLQELLPKLPESDQKLARKALFLGRVVNEYQEEFGRGDFLIRNLIGHDPQSGALAVGDFMRTGQTVQFQVRDGQSAAEDLAALLTRESKRPKRARPHGAVLFSCLGRGEGMYGAPNHDINALHQTIGPVATAGFFCNGEIGPIGEKPFVHGFTSVIGLFTEPETEH
jgi:small ligand-binding sensory domain FIST